MKTSIILGKKQLVLASLVLILGVAVYLNWQFASQNEDLSITQPLTDDAIVTNLNGNVIDYDLIEMTEPFDYVSYDIISESEIVSNDLEEITNDDEIRNFGDTLLVSGEIISTVTASSIVSENYFTTAKFTRTQARDEAVETIATVLMDENLTDEDKQQVSAKAIALTDIIEMESRIENLIKAKGFDECVVYITENSASVVVKTDGLDQDSATQIKNIIVSEGKIAGEKVSITEIA